MISLNIKPISINCSKRNTRTGFDTSANTRSQKMISFFADAEYIAKLIYIIILHVTFTLVTRVSPSALGM